ncbi:MAG: SDR family oxidoreductase [Polyangia bacterium]
MTQARSKTYVVTGANTGIGKAAVEQLAEAGAARIVIASRSPDKTDPVLAMLREKGVEAAFVQLELGDLASVRRAADELLEKDWTIDVLMNNAGIAGVQGITKDGFELAFGTNHLGHFLWTEKLLPLVKRAEQGRIVNVSSGSHYRAAPFDWDALRRTTKSYAALPEYAVSKLANVLHAKSLAKRLTDTKITTYSLHPGAVASDIWQRRMGPFAVLLKPLLITVEKGARTQVHCATAPELAAETGLYYDKSRPKTPSKLALDEKLRDELEAHSQEWVRPFLA